MAFSARRTKISPREHRATEEYIRGISSILDTVGVLANQLQKLRASFFLIVEYALDGETGDVATDPKSCSGTKAEVSICRAAH